MAVTRTIDFDDWLASVKVERARVRAVEAGFAEPYRRERHRDAEESQLLRQLGTPESLVGPPSDETARRRFAVPRAHGVFREIDLALLDPADRDERRILIEAEHPEFADALERDEELVVVDGEEVDPRLHLTLHEMIVEQLWEDDPPEAWRTAQRLTAAGYERHEILHMLGSALVPQLWRATAKGEASSTEEYLDALSRLPRSWEGTRPERAAGRASKGKVAAKARKAARRARKRNRRRE
jgi:Domain of unknown function (DUF1841)